MSETPLELLASALPQAQQIQRLQKRLLAGGRLTTFALILRTNEVLPYAHRLDGTRSVVLIGPDQAEQAVVLAQLRQDPDAILAAIQDDPVACPLGDSVLVRDLRTAVTEMAVSAVSGAYSEVAALGARGDGKTIGGGRARSSPTPTVTSRPAGPCPSACSWPATPLSSTG